MINTTNSEPRITFRGRWKAMPVFPSSWSLPEPPPGRQWQLPRDFAFNSKNMHRHRPLLDNERMEEGDEYSTNGRSWFPISLTIGRTVTKCAEGYRTRRPLPTSNWLSHHDGECPVPPETVVEVRLRNGQSRPISPARRFRWEHYDDFDIIAYRIVNPELDHLATVKAAHTAGKTVQWRMNENYPWHDFTPLEKFTDKDSQWQWRVKPEPRYVPLEASDVPPGSVFRNSSEQIGWCAPLAVTYTGIALLENDNRVTDYSWLELQSGHCAAQINRSIPLTGRWDATAWEKCEKEEK